MSTLEAAIANYFKTNPQSTNFRIDTGDYLGIEHEAYKTKLFQLALTDPDEYFKLREKVLEIVKKDAVSNQYDVYYNLLSEGKTSGGIPIVNALGQKYVKLFKPCVPLQETNQFALKASKTIDAICEEAIELLIPMDYKDIAEKRMKKKTEGNLGFA